MILGLLALVGSAAASLDALQMVKSSDALSASSVEDVALGFEGVTAHQCLHSMYEKHSCIVISSPVTVHHCSYEYIHTYARVIKPGACILNSYT